MLTKKIITGRRKTSVARVRLKSGSGKIVVNGQDALLYFKRSMLLGLLQQPLQLLDSEKKYDIFARLSGGGLSGQAGALRHAIARALDEIDPQQHRLLKTNKLLTRDDRKVQRKLFGHKKARKSFQFSKR